jgi:hypothetical protein
LQLHDLEGDVVATAADSETETKLLTSYNPTEFGVPVNGTPPTKYSWLGASGLTTEQSTGAANPGGSSYVPQLGRPLQTAPTVPPGSPTMMYVSPYVNALTPGMYESAAAYAAGALGREATRQEEAKKQWEREHPPAPPGITPAPGEGGPEPLGGYEGWACQYAAETGQEGEGCGDLASEGEGATTANVHAPTAHVGPCSVRALAAPFEDAELGATEWIVTVNAQCSFQTLFTSVFNLGGYKSGSYQNFIYGPRTWTQLVFTDPSVESGEWCMNLKWGDGEITDKCIPMAPV